MGCYKRWGVIGLDGELQGVMGGIGFYRTLQDIIGFREPAAIPHRPYHLLSSPKAPYSPLSNLIAPIISYHVPQPLSNPIAPYSPHSRALIAANVFFTLHSSLLITLHQNCRFSSSKLPLFFIKTAAFHHTTMPQHSPRQEVADSKLGALWN